MTIPSLLTPHYWFTISPAPFAPVQGYLVLAVFCACCILALAAYLFRLRSGLDKLTRRALVKTAVAGGVMGIAGLALLFFEYERIPVLTMRAFYLAWLVGAGYWAYRIYGYVGLEIPRIRREREAQDNFNKWLPKGKR